MIEPPAAMLFSGGLDSLCIWYLAGKPTPIYILTGHRYQDAERITLAGLQQRIPDFTPIHVMGPPIGNTEQPDGHVPHRNLALLVAAAGAVPTARTLLIGALLGEASPDKSRRFLRAASAAVTASENRPVKVVAPAHHLTKTGLLRLFTERHPYAAPLLAHTRSCYNPDQVCGDCPACFRRDVALFRVGLSPNRPILPQVVTPRAALRAAASGGLSRLPGLIANNTHAALAMWGPRPERWPT